jgi:hypothetical protein
MGPLAWLLKSSLHALKLPRRRNKPARASTGYVQAASNPRSQLPMYASHIRRRPRGVPNEYRDVGGLHALCAQTSTHLVKLRTTAGSVSPPREKDQAHRYDHFRFASNTATIELAKMRIPLDLGTQPAGEAMVSLIELTALCDRSG